MWVLPRSRRSICSFPDALTNTHSSMWVRVRNHQNTQMPISVFPQEYTASAIWWLLTLTLIVAIYLPFCFLIFVFYCLPILYFSLLTSLSYFFRFLPSNSITNQVPSPSPPPSFSSLLPPPPSFALEPRAIGKSQKKKKFRRTRQKRKRGETRCKERESTHTARRKRSKIRKEMKYRGGKAGTGDN